MTTEQIDALYAAPPALAAAGCPEAVFSLTIDGRRHGRKVLLTARGQSWAEFTTHLAQVESLLDAAPTDAAAGAAPQPEHWCAVHEVALEPQQNERGQWWSHKTADGWCRGKARRA